MTHLLLVRHGQTDWNRVERFRGEADVPLNARGVAEVEALATRIAADWEPQAIYSSPLTRAMSTAEAIARRVGLKVEPHSGLIDMNFGEWTGLTPEEAREKWPDQFYQWFNVPYLARIPGGESLADVRQRAMAAVDEILARHENASVVLVSHTDVNRTILLAALGIGNERFWRLRQDTAALNVIQYADGDFVVVSLNDTAHLREIETELTHHSVAA